MFEALAEAVAEGTASPFDAVASLASLGDEQVLALSQDEALAVIELTRDVLSALGAVQALAMEGYTRREEESLARFTADARARGDGLQFMPPADVMAGDALAVTLHQSPRSFSTQLGEIRTLVNDLPRTFALARAGRLEMHRARIVASEAILLAPSLQGEFDRQMAHPDTLRGGRPLTPLVDLPGPALRRRVTRTATRVDPDALRRRTCRAEKDRFVQVRPGVEPGTSFWSASQRSDVSAKAWAAIEALATTYLHADPAKTVGQCRADAMTDLILSNATITTTLDLLIPVSGADLTAPVPAAGTTADVDVATTTTKTAKAPRMRRTPRTPRTPKGTAGVDYWTPSPAEVIYLDQIRAHRAHEAHRDRDEAPPRHHPSEIPTQPPTPPASGPDTDTAETTSTTDALQCLVGVQHHRFGIILSAAVNALLADPDIRVRLHAVDEVSGVQLNHDPTTYRPGKALADAVRARDQHCRFPGCTAAAKTSDLDHVTPFPAGPTTLPNLIVLCRRHHLFKHHAGWHLTIDRDGVCTWTSPLDRVHTTHPATAHDTAA